MTAALTSADRVLVIAPHPDDESLAAGCLLQQARLAGAQAQVLFLTDGENNPWAQRAVERRIRVGPDDMARWAKRRREEALAALERLGVAPRQVEFLHLTDQGITTLLLENRSCPFSGPLAAFNPTVIAAPAFGDIHPDHSAAAVLLHLAIAACDRDAAARTVVFRPRTDVPADDGAAAIGD